MYCNTKKAPIAALLLLALSLAGCDLLIGLSDRKLADAAVDAGGQDASRDASQGADQDAGPDASLDAGQDGGAANSQELCQRYCTTVLQACTGKYQPYADTATCLSACALMPAGDSEEAQPLGNTVACRVHQAELAMKTQEPWDHCVPAGPGGRGVCGDNCEGYCQLLGGACGDDAAVDCERRCAGLRDLDAEDKARFDDSTLDLKVHQEGETLQCRIVHASAALLDPSVECARATIAPRPIDGMPHPCSYPEGESPRCEDYCGLSRVACTAELSVYESESQCLKACAATPVGQASDSGGQNTVGCRIAHSYNALEGPSTHCPHSGPGGESVCGDDCESYCTLLSTACSTEFAAAFSSNATCVSACGSIDPGPKYAVSVAEDGDNVACRMLHTVRAISDPASCSAALGASPCVP